MRRTCQVLAAAALLAVPLAAQPGRGPAGRGMMMTVEELTGRLNLDASQQSRIRSLLDRFAADTRGARETLMGNMQAVRNGETTREAVEGENQAARLVIREFSDSLDREIRAQLRPDQVNRFDAYLAERAQRMGNRRPPGG